MENDTTKSENLARYLAHLEKIGHANLIPPKRQSTNLGKLAMDLCAEGQALLDAEEKAKAPVAAPPVDDKKKLDTALATASPNPYVRARIKVLNGMTESRRKMIETMEKTGDINNRTYDDFTKAVAEQGDKLSA
jgi:hypothetical protein